MGSKESANLVRRLFHRKQSTWLSWTQVIKLVSWLPVFALVLAASLFAIDRWVSYQAREQLFTNVEQIDKFDVAVVLGTSKYLGKILNEYYSHRMDAAVELYKEGKVAHFLLSGDNAHRSYNEPWTMKRDLLKAEVPEEKIFLDYAGFRTLDSVVRAKEIFDTDNFLIISQKFHCERALFIAKSHNINASCFAVPGPSRHSGWKVRVREIFARAKAVLDIYVINAKPKFLGPKEPILSADNDSADTELELSLEETEQVPELTH
ncbi:SanA/YdcF family protein [Vibrio ouci]|uniref:SanA/YdcF family protein n=1 Tax=Vibrio ouci TaxID=2499078 RepID=UPI001ABFDE8D|nr:ElyC/SanA/YdcF family protein [Vibrio ouci]